MFTSGRWIGAALALAATVVGCREESQAPPPGDPVSVVAPVYPLAAIAREVGGERVTTDWFREGGQPPSALDATPERRSRLRSAQLVVTDASQQPWTLEGIDNPYRTDRIIRLAPPRRTTTAPASTPATTTPASTSSSQPAAPPAAPIDGYLWLDPDIARAGAGVIADRLATLDPRHAEMFRANAARFVVEMDEVVREHERSAATMPATSPGGGRPPFLSLDPGFDGLARRFGFAPVDVTSGRPMRLPPSDGDLRRIRLAARESGARVVYVPVDTPPAVLRDLQDRLAADGVTVLTLDALGSSAPRGRRSYAELLRYNLAQLRRGLAGERENIRMDDGG